MQMQNDQLFLDYISNFFIEKEGHPALLAYYESAITTFIDHAPLGIYIVENNNYSYVNHYYAKLVGYEREELMQGSVTLEAIVHPEDYALYIQQLQNLKQDKSTSLQSCCRIRKIHKNGRVMNTELHASYADFLGKTIYFVGVVDVTQQVLERYQLKESRERYQFLFSNSPEAIYVFNADGQLTSVNPSYEMLTGYTASELLNNQLLSLVIPEDQQRARILMEQASGGMPSSGDVVMERKDGTLIHVNLTHFPMEVDDQIIGIYGLAKDMTAKIQYDKEMEQLAYYDSLTQLPNRKWFQEKLDETIAASASEPGTFAVLFLDLDGFKKINDSFGHHLGDELLKEVALRLKQTIHSEDTISRLAGDEFTVLARNVTEHQAVDLAKRMHTALTAPFEVEGHFVAVSVSIGIALGGDELSNAQRLVRQADLAMYFSKKYKKSSYTVYSDEMEKKATYNYMLERDLNFAIKREELELFYQPIVNLKTKKIIVMEALLRWRNPQLGMVPPCDFIPIAEESGQILEIGTWVLEQVCRQIVEWEREQRPPFKVAVNVSYRQLQHPEFAKSVKDILKQTKVDPHCIELEITESSFSDDVEQIKDTLFELKQEGISIAIDDFGTGYTSFSYLRQYPFDKLKIDRSFIGDISRNLNGKQIASAIISLAHSLNMKVLAEGIENEAELQYLMEELCDEGQGYLISHPKPANAIGSDLFSDIESMFDRGDPIERTKEV